MTTSTAPPSLLAFTGLRLRTPPGQFDGRAATEFFTDPSSAGGSRGQVGASAVRDAAQPLDEASVGPGQADHHARRQHASAALGATRDDDDGELQGLLAVGEAQGEGEQIAEPPGQPRRDKERALEVQRLRFVIDLHEELSLLLRRREVRPVHVHHHAERFARRVPITPDRSGRSPHERTPTTTPKRRCKSATVGVVVGQLCAIAAGRANRPGPGAVDVDETRRSVA